MLASQLIDSALPVLHAADNIATALLLMQEHHAPLLPVTDDKGVYIGIAPEAFLLDQHDDLQLLSSLHLPDAEVTILPEEHIFNVLQKAAQYNLSYIPVVDNNDHLLGIISPEKIVISLAKDSAAKEPGGIIVLQMNSRDYSLAGIARIVESNNANVLHAFLTSQQDSEKILVTLKISKQDLKEILLSFERFEYEVVAVYHVSEYENGLKERYDSLMMYLNV